MDKKGILAGIVIALIFIAVGCYVVIDILNATQGEGTITDKYILPNIAGYPKYYLVLDDTKDITVGESIYYDYKVGDYYPENPGELE